MKTILLTILILIFVFQSSIFSQNNVEKAIEKYSCDCENETAVRDYFEHLETQKQFITECTQEIEANRKLDSKQLPMRISGFSPRAVNLVKPYYPKSAKRLGILGEVLVEVFTDEKGFVIYSRILKGNGFLRESVRRAACLSKFTPIQYCGKLTKARWLIKYNFIAN